MAGNWSAQVAVIARRGDRTRHSQANALRQKPRRYTTAVASTPIRKRALDRFAEQAREILGPKLLELRLFGSEARGEAGPDSDLDVLVVVQANADVPPSRTAHRHRVRRQPRIWPLYLAAGGHTHHPQ